MKFELFNINLPKTYLSFTIRTWNWKSVQDNLMNIPTIFQSNLYTGFWGK